MQHACSLHTLPTTITFDRIVWNFPHAWGEWSDECSTLHHALLRDFFASCARDGKLSQRGEVHISLIGKQHRRWRLVDAANSSGFHLAHSVPFSKELFSAYRQTRETGGDASTFPVDGISRTFCFVRSEGERQAVADFSSVSPASEEEWLALIARSTLTR